MILYLKEDYFWETHATVTPLIQLLIPIRTVASNRDNILYIIYSKANNMLLFSISTVYVTGC